MLLAGHLLYLSRLPSFCIHLLLYRIMSEDDRGELNAFLKTFDDVHELIKWACDYDKEQDPDVLERITELKEVSDYFCSRIHFFLFSNLYSKF